MLYPEQVIPFLLHDDPSVRRHAIGYVDRCTPPGPFTADHLWAGIDRFAGTPEANSFARALRYAPPTDASLRRLLNVIARGTAETNGNDYYDALCETPLPMLLRHRDLILGTPNLVDDVAELFENRLRFADEPTAVLWQRLMDAGRKFDDPAHSDAGDYDSEALIAALGERGGDEVGELALPVLADDAACRDWREIFAMQVLGRARYAPAIDALVQKFASDSDAAWEEAHRALIRIGTADVVERIAAYYPTQTVEVRISAMVPLEHIKLPESEAAILKLVATEDDFEQRVQLLGQLTFLGSLAGLDRARVEIADEPDHPEILGLCEELLAAAVMNGVDLPEAAEWQARIDARNRRQSSLDNASELLEKAVARMRTHYFGEEPSRPAAEVIDELTPRPDEITMPIHRNAPKVGRNDPCPCGSGKKYKKCCADK